MKFVDEAKVQVIAGDGGSGIVSWRREKYVPKGGPDGGDGGRGGHIILKGNSQLWTLLHLKYRKHIIAGVGGNGGPNQSSGKQGEDQIIEVPIGTVRSRLFRARNLLKKRLKSYAEERGYTDFRAKKKKQNIEEE